MTERIAPAFNAPIKATTNSLENDGKMDESKRLYN